MTDDAGEEVLPFDIDAPLIDICDDDYGLWYMDAMDNPKKYNGKKGRFRAVVYHTLSFYKKPAPLAQYIQFIIKEIFRFVKDGF